MLSRKKSAQLSFAICVVLSIALFVLLFTFPAFLKWFFSVGAVDSAEQLQKSTSTPVCICFYIGSVFGGITLYSLMRLLKNIIDDKPFIRQNVRYVDTVSLCCYAVTLDCFVGCFFYIPLIFISIAAGIMGTLLRVVKNIMHTATELREENDLTV